MWINVKVQITWTKRKHGETFGVLFLAESVSFIRRWFLAQWSKSVKSRWKTERCQTHKGKAQRTPIHTITLLWKECQNMGFYCIRLWQMKKNEVVKDPYHVASVKDRAHIVGVLGFSVSPVTSIFKCQSHTKGRFLIMCIWSLLKRGAIKSVCLWACRCRKCV